MGGGIFIAPTRHKSSRLSAVCAALGGAQYVKYLSQPPGLDYRVCSEKLSIIRDEIFQIGSSFYLLWVTLTPLLEEQQKNPL